MRMRADMKVAFVGLFRLVRFAALQAHPDADVVEIGPDGRVTVDGMSGRPIPHGFITALRFGR